MFTLDLAQELWKVNLDRSIGLQAWLVLWGAQTALLWLLWGWLRPQQRKLAQDYGKAANGWAIVLAIPLALTLSGLFAHPSYRSGITDVTLAETTMLTALLPSLALMFSLWRIRSNGAALGLGLFMGIALGGLLDRVNASPIQSAFAFLALGWLALLAGELWLSWQTPIAPSPSTREISTAKANAPQPKQNRFARTISRPLEQSCHLLPLGYVGISLVFGHLSFGPYSGLVTLLSAFILLGVSRRHRPFNILGYLGLGTASIGCFELLLYQLSQASGGDAGDGLVLIGLLSIGLAWALRLLLPLLRRALRLDATGLRQFAAGHWGLASFIGFTALLMSLSDQGGLLWMGLMAIAGLYALVAARQAPASLWLDAALVQLLSALGYAIHRLFYWPTFLAWAAVVACPIAMALEVIPWERLGWSRRAGQRWAALLPGVATLLTGWTIPLQGLLLVASFYGGLAQRRCSIRLSYLSLGLLDWAILKLMVMQQLTEPLWFGLLFSANLLYLAQLDPALKTQRDLRHWLRCLGTAIACFTALYQAEVGLGALGGFGTGLVAIALSLGFVLAGLALRVRAFLYVGTIAFVLRVLLQVWQYIQTDSLFLWAIGIVLGLLLIWIAATFEARRSQLSALLNRWLVGLETWH